MRSLGSEWQCDPDPEKKTSPAKFDLDEELEGCEDKLQEPKGQTSGAPRTRKQEDSDDDDEEGPDEPAEVK